MGTPAAAVILQKDCTVGGRRETVATLKQST